MPAHLLNACCADEVIESASSKMMILCCPGGRVTCKARGFDFRETKRETGATAREGLVRVQSLTILARNTTFSASTLVEVEDVFYF